MKSRTIAVALMVSSLLVMAASGQPRADKIKVIAEAVLQDDNSGSFLVINLTTGEYKFRDCTSDFTMGGFATVNITGCTASANDISEERLVVADINLCGGEAKARIVTEPLSGAYGAKAATREYTINDSNMRDSVAECKTPEK